MLLFHWVIRENYARLKNIDREIIATRKIIATIFEQFLSIVALPKNRTV